jgi:hypothetical protein
MNEEETKRYVTLIEERDMYKSIVKNYHEVIKSQMVGNLCEAEVSSEFGEYENFRDCLNKFNELKKIFLENKGDSEQINNWDNDAKNLESKLKSIENNNA